MLVMPALRRQTQEERCTFEDSLIYTANFMIVKNHSGAYCLGPPEGRAYQRTCTLLTGVHTWIYYSHVILHMEEVANIEFVQIGGVL